MAAELTIKLVRGATESMTVQLETLEQTTVRQLKEIIAQKDTTAYPVDAQRLIFQGQILQDDKLLIDYNIKAGCALHLTLTRTTTTPSTSPTSNNTVNGSVLRSYLEQMRASCSPEQFTTAVQTLQKICENILQHPQEEKYRKLRPSNAALKAKVFDRIKGMESVQLLGFQDGIEEGLLVLVPTAEKWEALVAHKRTIDGFVTTSTPSFGGSNPLFGGTGGVNNLGNMAAMLQNPMMAQMLQNDPMIRQMAQLNPMVAQALQNPSMLAQQLQMLQQNPALMQSMSQMLQNPQAMQQMQQMMLGGGSLGGLGGVGGFGGASVGTLNPFAASTTASSTPNPFAPSTTASPTPTRFASTSTSSASSAPSTAATNASPSTEEATDETFDEAEIADAIARSLQEQ